MDLSKLTEKTPVEIDQQNRMKERVQFDRNLLPDFISRVRAQTEEGGDFTIQDTIDTLQRAINSRETLKKFEDDDIEQINVQEMLKNHSREELNSKWRAELKGISKALKIARQASEEHFKKGEEKESQAYADFYNELFKRERQINKAVISLEKIKK